MNSSDICQGFVEQDRMVRFPGGHSSGPGRGWRLSVDMTEAAVCSGPSAPDQSAVTAQPETLDGRSDHQVDYGLNSRQSAAVTLSGICGLFGQQSARQNRATGCVIPLRPSPEGAISSEQTPPADGRKQRPGLLLRIRENPEAAGNRVDFLENVSTYAEA